MHGHLAVHVLPGWMRLCTLWRFAIRLSNEVLRYFSLLGSVLELGKSLRLVVNRPFLINLDMPGATSAASLDMDTGLRGFSQVNGTTVMLRNLPARRLGANVLFFLCMEWALVSV